MMETGKLKYIYLLGAGGIGMSALGRYFLNQGSVVAGYDKTRTPLTDELIAEGLKISFDDSIDTLPDFIKTGPSAEKLIIYTPAVPADSVQLNFIIEQGFKPVKRANVLGMIASAHKTIAVAGTHGKTTTSTLIAHVLSYAGFNPVAFLGGISVNYGSNYLKGSADSILVAEADEFDRSFLTLNPDTGIITSTDADHLDIYGNPDALIQSFSDFAKSVKRKLILKSGLPLSKQLYSTATTYHTSFEADVMLESCRIESDRYTFSIRLGNKIIENITLGIPGYHNVENALAAIAIAIDLGIPENTIRKALETFQGVKRRFEYIIRNKNLVFIDDYAHHPAELKAFIGSVKEMYSNKKITGLFQPHLFSRTRDFLDAFADSLSMLDEVYLMEIYPAREKPIPGITSSALLERINHSSARLVDAEEFLKIVSQNQPEVLLTMGAGDIDRIVKPLKDLLMVKTENYESQS
jgi:UDP-N-acetylmuramate--alanine ligase